MEIGGWKTRSMFHRYDVIDRSDGQDAMRKLDEHRRKNQAAEESRSAGTGSGTVGEPGPACDHDQNGGKFVD